MQQRWRCALPKMEKMQFFVKYQQNQPVKIKSHFKGGGQDRSDPLTDVADLVTACAADQTRKLLGLPEDFGPLTLHLIEGDAISGNTLLTSIQTRGTYEKPLIIKSKKNMIGADESESLDLLKEEKKKGILLSLVLC